VEKDSSKTKAEKVKHFRVGENIASIKSGCKENFGLKLFLVAVKGTIHETAKDHGYLQKSGISYLNTKMVDPN